MPRRPMTAEDLWNVPVVGVPAPSPDGAELVVPVTTYSVADNKGKTRLWRVPSDATRAGRGVRGDAARPLTGTDDSSNSPAWSPDGASIAFIRKPGGSAQKGGPEHVDQAQVHVMPADGGEAQRLTDLPHGVAGLRWFPDGRRIAFTSKVHIDTLTLDGAATRKKTLADEPVQPCVTEDRYYRLWDSWLTDGLIHHVFVLDLDSGAVVDVTPRLTRRFIATDAGTEFDIAPDGRELAFSAECPRGPADLLHWSVYTVRLPARVRASSRLPAPKSVTPKGQADGYTPRYSPDGRWLVFGVKDESGWDAPTRLAVIDRATRKSTIIVDGWDLDPSQWSFAESGGDLYVRTDLEGRAALFALSLQTAAATPTTTPTMLFEEPSFGAACVRGGRVFAAVSSARAPSEIVCHALVRGAGERTSRSQVTGFTHSVMRELDMGRVRDVTFEGADGDPVQMFIVDPPKSAPDRSKRGKLPLVHLIHGGPHGVFGDQWHARWNAQIFASAGYRAALVNFHGSQGFGHAFRRSIVGAWGDKPYTDVMCATDWLIQRGLADPKRMAATGGSYGGYMASWIASQTDRFACIVNHAGVCDLLHQFASDIPQDFASCAGGEPWADQEGLHRYDPIHHAAGFQTPMLILHGEKDYRVPYYEALEMYNVYKLRGLPARLVVYPEENHWILKPKNSLHWYGEFIGWLDRWMG